MGKRRKIFSLGHLASAVLMVAALAWLTISLPYVNKAQQDYKQLCKQTGESKATDDNNPLSNTNEEKSESGNPLLAEYLHEAPMMENHFTILSTSHRCHPSALYLAYHPELLIPPPEV